MDALPESLRGEATACLARVAAGHRSARSRLFEMVYSELRDQASTALRNERAGHTLQSTALVHEAWIRLIDQGQGQVSNKGHFLALAALAMRRILVDHARGRSRQKRGGSWERLELEEAGPPADDGPSGLDLLAIDEALDRLREQSERMARIVELRFFGGLSREEVADVLGVSRSTVLREWRAAKALMSRFLDGDGEES